ncbi:hypothetical protein [Gemmatimonas sp.]|uniref:hypothetical protein n=1 Tax=Gemmatimonas sp. TaxID=1962908 RepID=UPI003DA69701
MRLHGRRTAIAFAVAFPVHWRGNGRFHDEGAGHPRDFLLLLGAIDQHFHGGRLIVGDALECNVRHEPAHFFTTLVLFAHVGEATGGAARRILERVSWFSVNVTGGWYYNGIVGV